MNAPDLSPKSLAGRKVLVVGLGPTGLSCAHHLHRHGATVAVTDSRTAPPALEQLRDELPDVALMIGGFVDSAFAAAQVIVVGPGLPLSTRPVAEALASGTAVVGDVELFAQAAKAPVVGITGTNGKSTVTTLLGQMAREAGKRTGVGGNLGEPALTLLDDAADLYVIELSSFQLETTHSLRLVSATVLNLSPDHLDRHGDMRAYAAAKQRIFAHADSAVVNRDDAAATALAATVERQTGFTLGAPTRDTDWGVCTHLGTDWICRGDERVLSVDELVLPGKHNLANALAALALGERCGLERAPMLEVLRRFRGLAHRSELVADHNDIRWIDDSKGTNPGATVAALAGLVPNPERRKAVLIAGGDCKDADFAPLAEAVRRGARAVVLIGRDADRLASALADTVPLHRAADLDDAVRQAAALAAPGDCVLLSPACASFDMFDDYRHRGRVFAESVRRWVP
jgi:UDP-N-acetylmuramoylalanine--D-glutamate ligase